MNIKEYLEIWHIHEKNGAIILVDVTGNSKNHTLIEKVDPQTLTLSPLELMLIGKECEPESELSKLRGLTFQLKLIEERGIKPEGSLERILNWHWPLDRTLPGEEAGTIFAKNMRHEHRRKLLALKKETRDYLEKTLEVKSCANEPLMIVRACWSRIKDLKGSEKGEGRRILKNALTPHIQILEGYDPGDFFLLPASLAEGMNKKFRFDIIPFDPVYVEERVVEIYNGLRYPKGNFAVTLVNLLKSAAELR